MHGESMVPASDREKVLEQAPSCTPASQPSSIRSQGFAEVGKDSAAELNSRFTRLKTSEQLAPEPTRQEDEDEIEIEDSVDDDDATRLDDIEEEDEAATQLDSSSNFDREEESVSP